MLTFVYTNHYFMLTNFVMFCEFLLEDIFHCSHVFKVIINCVTFIAECIIFVCELIDHLSDYHTNARHAAIFVLEKAAHWLRVM